MPASAASVAREGPVADDRIRGVIIPIVTPLTPDYEVDTSSLRRLVAYMIDNGVHGIWTAGTTGEFASLTDAQRALVTETIVDEVNARVPIIVNVSGAGNGGRSQAGRGRAGAAAGRHSGHAALLLPVRRRTSCWTTTGTYTTAWGCRCGSTTSR